MSTMVHVVILLLGLLTACISVFIFGGFPACRDGFQEFVCVVATAVIAAVGAFLMGWSLHLMGKDDWENGAGLAFVIIYCGGIVRTIRQFP